MTQTESNSLQSILDYKIIRLIGKGGFSEVYLAQKGDQDFAIKVMMPPPGVKSEDVLQSLRYEFWVLKDLIHPHIVRVYDFGQLSDGRIFIVEEFLQGVTLEQFCFKKKFSEIAPLFLQILSGLGAIHSWKIIHGDIKSKNIMVVNTDAGPVARILDFGLARPLGGHDNPNDSGFRGTPATMAPEIILKEKADARSDLYSLGVTFYEVLRGKNPFLGPNIDATLKRHLGEMPDPIGLYRADVSPAWGKLLHRLMAKNPLHRIQSASQGMSLISESHFVLAPTVFVGRQKELGCVQEILSHLAGNKKLTVIVGGEPGVGKNRFIKEVFYQVISKHPAAREKITVGSGHDGSALIHLEEEKEGREIDRDCLKIMLHPMTSIEVREWLGHVFFLDVIPEPFVARVIELSRGLPRLIWDLLLFLDQKKVLTDAAGRVTKNSLTLIRWEEAVAGSKDGADLSQNFDYLFDKISQRVKSREMAPDHPLWQALETSISKTANASEQLLQRARFLYLKGASFIDLSDFPQARQMLSTALEILGMDSRNLIETLKIKNYLAYIELRQGRVAEAIHIYESVRADILGKLSAEDKKQIRNNDLGLAYLQDRQWQQAFDTLAQDVKWFDTTGDQAQKVFALYNMAQAAFYLGKTNDAQNLYRQTMTLARDTHNPAFLLRAYNGLGNVLGQSEQWAEALSAYTEALEVALALGDFTSASAAMQNRGALRGQHGQFEEAIQDLELSLQYGEKIPRKFAYEKTLMCRSLLELGEIYRKRTQLDEARQHLDRAWYQAENDADLASYRFWVLKARAELWLEMKKWDRFKQELSQLNYFADDEQKKQSVLELKNRYQDLKKAVPSEREVRLERELEVILKINRDLVGEMSLDELLKRILSHAIELTRSELGVILLVDEKQKLTPRLSLNADLDQDLSEISISVAERVLKTGQVIKTADAASDGEFNQYSSVMHLSLKSILGAPIVFKGQVLGVLYLSHRYQVGLFDEKNIRTIVTFADQAGLALKNHQLFEFYRKHSESLAEELEATQLSLTQAREKLKSGTKIFSESAGGKTFLTRSASFMETITQLERVAGTNLPIVIQGESGTGKEVLARYVHGVSKRHKKPFIAINCGALPVNLVESELFGHKRGAFTGADHDKVGLIEAASGGTLFLDEITDLPLDTQVKLLRVLQEQEIVRLGETNPRAVDVRILAASHKNLKEAVQKKTFREDLFFRLSGMEVVVPPLRERHEDITLLAEHYLKSICKDQGRDQPEKISTDLMKLMITHQWPGNIRELKNFIEVGVSLCEGRILKKDHFPQYLIERICRSVTISRSDGGVTETPVGWYDPRKTWKDHELLIYTSALHKFDFDPLRVANSLKVGVATVYKWMRDHRLKQAREDWIEKILPYEEGLTLNDIRSHVFQLAARRHPGHPYQAARELGVAPVTFYRWSKL